MKHHRPQRHCSAPANARGIKSVSTEAADGRRDHQPVEGEKRQAQIGW